MRESIRYTTTCVRKEEGHTATPPAPAGRQGSITAATGTTTASRASMGRAQAATVANSHAACTYTMFRCASAVTSGRQAQYALGGVGAHDDLAILNKAVVWHLQVVWRRALADASRGVIVGAVAGAEPGMVVPSVVQGDAAQVRAHTHHNQPLQVGQRRQGPGSTSMGE
jgi:hypothetical protein